MGPRDNYEMITARAHPSLYTTKEHYSSLVLAFITGAAMGALAATVAWAVIYG